MEQERKTVDVVWLKRDVRLVDHGPLAAIAHSPRPVVLLYLYEPDQLSEHSVHGSHIAVINEGLVDVDRQLSELGIAEKWEGHSFQWLTVCYSGAIVALEEIHAKFGVARLFAHEETGHLKSYERDRHVRRWCKSCRVPFVEFAQSGVTRCLKDRDGFSQKLKSFLAMKPHATPNVPSLRSKIIQISSLKGFCLHPMLEELP